MQQKELDKNLQMEPITKIEKQIAACQNELEKLNNRKNFPYVYIVVAIPTTILFMLLTYISNGLLSLTTGITGSLFFSLLITSTYVVLYQPTKEELVRDLIRQIKKLNRDKAKMIAGIKGEKDVQYALKWLPEEYVVINNVNLAAHNLESQQIDHLVVGPNGIFHLETKNINGAILITSKGEWSILKASQNRVIRENIESPYQQIERHEAVLNKIVAQHFKKGKIPLVSLVVLAHPRTIIEGVDPQLYVVKKDRVTEFIRNFQPEIQLSPKKIRAVTLSVIDAVVE